MLFTDGTGEVNVFDPADLSSGKKPEGRTSTSAEPHHGVAIELADGTLLSTLGTEEKRTGTLVLDKNNKEIARNEDCPGVHGEAAARNEAIGIGCEDGILIFEDGKFTKIDALDDYGRIGNQAGSDTSPILLGDYRTDPEAEWERPTRISLIDTEKKKLRLVNLGTGYSFRSLARGPHGRRRGHTARLDRPGPDLASPSDGITVGTVVSAAQCHVAAVMQRCAQPDAGRLVTGLRVDEVHLAVAAPGDGDPIGAR